MKHRELKLRLTDEEHDKLFSAAHSNGIPAEEWSVNKLMAAVRKSEKKK